MSPQATPLFENPVRIPVATIRQPTLDGLRGCAVLLVLVNHFVALHPRIFNAALATPLSYLRAALGLTASGVDLFFVLSGFLIGGILLDYRESPQLLPTFYARRALRILPLAWLHIAIVLFFAPVAAPGGDQPAAWWIYFGFLTNFHLAHLGHWSFSALTPHWSLAIEEQFYLAFPFLVLLCPRPKLPWLGPLVIAGAIGSRIVCWRVHPDNLFATHMLPYCRMDALACGFTCACLVRSAWWSKFQTHRRRLWLAWWPLFGGLAVLLKLHAAEADPAMVTWGYTVLALFYAITLLLVYQPPAGPVRAFFSAAWLRLYGRYSYFIYLFQGVLAAPLVALLFFGRMHSPGPMTVAQVLAVPVVLLLPAALSWHFIESPLLKLGHRLRYGPEVRPI